MRTAHATDGDTALTLHHTLKPDLILLDLQLPGLDPQHAEHIFDAFSPYSPSRARQSGGTVLGLAVVNAIAEAHGGQALYLRSGNEGSLLQIQWQL